MNECIDHVNPLCVILDTDEDSVEFKRVRWADEKRERGENPGKKPDTNKVTPDNQGGLPKCWDCGQEGHRRDKCPEHFKYKPKGRNPSAPVTQEGETTEIITGDHVENASGSQ